MSKQFAFGLVVTTILSGSHVVYAAGNAFEKEDKDENSRGHITVQPTFEREEGRDNLRRNWVVVGDPDRNDIDIDEDDNNAFALLMSASLSEQDDDEEEDELGSVDFARAEELLDEYIQEEQQRLSPHSAVGFPSSHSSVSVDSVLDEEEDDDNNNKPVAFSTSDTDDEEEEEEEELGPEALQPFGTTTPIEEKEEDPNAMSAASFDTPHPYLPGFDELRAEIHRFYFDSADVFSTLLQEEMKDKSKKFGALAEKAQAMHGALDEMQASLEDPTEEELSLIDHARIVLVLKESNLHDLVQRFHFMAKKKGWTFSIPESDLERALEAIEVAIYSIIVPMHIADLRDKGKEALDLSDEELVGKVRALAEGFPAIQLALDAQLAALEASGEDDLWHALQLSKIARVRDSFKLKENKFVDFLAQVQHVAEKRRIDFSTFFADVEGFATPTATPTPKPTSEPTPKPGMKKASGASAKSGVFIDDYEIDPRQLLYLEEISAEINALRVPYFGEGVSLLSDRELEKRDAELRGLAKRVEDIGFALEELVNYDRGFSGEEVRKALALELLVAPAREALEEKRYALDNLQREVDSLVQERRLVFSRPDPERPGMSVLAPSGYERPYYRPSVPAHPDSIASVARADVGGGAHAVALRRLVNALRAKMAHLSVVRPDEGSHRFSSRVFPSKTKKGARQWQLVEKPLTTRGTSAKMSTKGRLAASLPEGKSTTVSTPRPAGGKSLLMKTNPFIAPLVSPNTVSSQPTTRPRNPSVQPRTDKGKGAPVRITWGKWKKVASGLVRHSSGGGSKIAKQKRSSDSMTPSASEGAKTTLINWESSTKGGFKEKWQSFWSGLREVVAGASS